MTAPVRRLVIVESPAKAKTIAGYLGDGWVVESSVGHVRDLPAKTGEVPASLRERFGDPSHLGVDVEAGFEPYYRVLTKSKPNVKRLKELLGEVDELYLATDEDREGESIAWHLLEELKPKVPVRRMVFNEITRDAIQRAAQDTRELDANLVEAQETRRILDRLYGYPISQLLWRKLTNDVSAGRVLSVATRLLVDRERARIAFRAASYWDLTARLATEDTETVVARLVEVDGAAVATGGDFDSLGRLSEAAQRTKVVLDETAVREIADGLASSVVRVRSVEAKPYKRSPYAPFRTTTLQQESGRKLGFTAQRTMSAAQGLYQDGFITYMRTDSTTLSPTAVTAARDQVLALYGPDYLPDKPRTFANRVKNAQEAHEAIRPAGETFRTPAQTGLTGDAFRLYELIWMRTIASQMPDAVGESVSVRFAAALAGGRGLVLAASGKVITFPGFLRAYVEGQDDPEAETDAAERRLPQLAEGQQLGVREVRPEPHQTKPPARFTEASLVTELEKREIGRPSTYAATIAKVLRTFADKRGTAIVPTWTAFAVTRLLEEHFADLVDYAFTARMEDVLDQISLGDSRRVEALTRFWGGDQEFPGLVRLLDSMGEIDARRISTFPIMEQDGTPSGLSVRVGRRVTSVEADEETSAVVPDGLAPDELTAEKARDLLAAKAAGNRELGPHPETGLGVGVRTGRFGPYVEESLPDGAPKKAKPRRASLLSSMDPATVSLDDVLPLLALPRLVGELDGQPVQAFNGRYGPYLSKGTEQPETRSLPDEGMLLTVTLDEAQALFAQPKTRGRPAAAPGKVMGQDPASGVDVTLKDGRFGPYVTDGTTNASIPRGEAVEDVTLQRALDLLAERRAKGPVKKAAKRAPAKKAAKRAPAKKAAARKSPAKKAVAEPGDGPGDASPPSDQTS